MVGVTPGSVEGRERRELQDPSASASASASACLLVQAKVSCVDLGKADMAYRGDPHSKDKSK